MMKRFLSFLLFMCCITFIDLCVLNHARNLGWSWFCHGGWSLWCVVGFGLPLLY
jgi:hypothetical protein